MGAANCQFGCTDGSQCEIRMDLTMCPLGLLRLPAFFERRNWGTCLPVPSYVLDAQAVFTQALHRD